VNFAQFITRADAQVLQELLGARVLRLLRALDFNGFNLVRQRELLLQQAKPQTLLANATSRTALLDLLRPAEAEQLCRVLGLDTTSPHQALATASFRSTRLETLLSYFELSPLIEEHASDLEARTVVRPAHALFSHQERAARKCVNALHRGNRRVLLHMPTGAGKTRTAMHVIAERLRSHPTKAVIWLAHSEELCEQAASEFERAWANLGSRDVAIHRFWGGRELKPDQVGADFIVAGLSKMNAVVRSRLALIGGLGARTSLVVMDEAHQAIAPTYQLILDALVVPFQGSALLGLSATPGRTWNDVGADETLARFFGRQKVGLEVDGYDNPVDFLVAEGYLAQTIFRPLLVNSGVELGVEDKRRLESDLEIPSYVLERLAEDEMRNLAILTEIEQLARRHKRIIVFATTVEHSDLLAYTLRARGLWARSVTGTSGYADRHTALKDYKSDANDVRIICNFGVLTTGFDAPKTSAAVIARPTISLVLYSQMVGRAIRGVRAGGNPEAEIVTVVDRELPGFGGVGDAFLNWEDIWGEP
jgi:DNA repair protein RadD